MATPTLLQARSPTKCALAAKGWRRTGLSLDAGSDETNASASLLDWTSTPIVQVRQEGQMCCFVAEPKVGAAARPEQALLMREFDLIPSKFAKRGATDTSKRPVDLYVREQDLRKCGSDLEMLKQCHLPLVQGPRAPGSGLVERRRPTGGLSLGGNRHATSTPCLPANTERATTAEAATRQQGGAIVPADLLLAKMPGQLSTTPRQTPTTPGGRPGTAPSSIPTKRATSAVRALAPLAPIVPRRPRSQLASRGGKARPQ